jgi:hypothetical protein
LIIAPEIHNFPEDGNPNDQVLALSLESKTQLYKRPFQLNPSVSACYISISDATNVVFKCVDLGENARVYQSAHKPLNAMTAEQPEDKTLDRFN